LYLKFSVRCDVVAIFTDSYLVYMQLHVLPHYQYFTLKRENTDCEKTRMSKKMYIFFYID